MPKHNYFFELAKYPEKMEEIHRIMDKFQINCPMDREMRYFVLAYDHKEPIGIGCITLEGKIESLKVDPAWRGKTVGHAILVYLQHIAGRLYLPSMWVETPESTGPFFEKKGFAFSDDRRHDRGTAYRRMVYVFETRESLH